MMMEASEESLAAVNRSGGRGRISFHATALGDLAVSEAGDDAPDRSGSTRDRNRRFSHTGSIQERKAVTPMKARQQSASLLAGCETALQTGAGRTIGFALTCAAHATVHGAPGT